MNIVNCAASCSSFSEGSIVKHPWCLIFFYFPEGPREDQLVATWSIHSWRNWLISMKLSMFDTEQWGLCLRASRMSFILFTDNGPGLCHKFMTTDELAGFGGLRLTPLLENQQHPLTICYFLPLTCKYSRLQGKRLSERDPEAMQQVSQTQSLRFAALFSGLTKL